MNRISFFQRANNTKPVEEFDVIQYLDRIRTGASRELVERIRKADDATRADLKKQLPGVTGAGAFTTREDDALKQPSGWAVLDFDHLANPAEFRDYIAKQDYILAAYISPSGDGVKAWAKIPAVKDKAEYKARYEALLREIDNEATDPANKNVSRLTFDSWDPDIIIKDPEKVSEFTGLAIEPDRPAAPASAQPTGKTDDKQFNKIMAKMAARGEVYTIGNRNPYVHNLACNCNRAGIPEADALAFILKTFKEKSDEETTGTVRGVYTRHADEFGKDTADMAAMTAACLVDPTSPRPDEPVILTIDGQPVANQGGITTNLGKAKSRKTHHNTHQAAAFVRGGKLGNHEAILPPDKNIVLYFDTEQQAGEAWDVVNKIRRTARTGLDRLRYFSLRPFNPKQRTQFIDYTISTTAGVGVVFIDGVRDLVSNINDPDEATEALTALMRWTNNYHLHIFATLHLNKSDNNARGHLGTELMNKSQTIINIEKSDSGPFSIVSFTDGRGMGFKPYALGYDSEGLPADFTTDEVTPAKKGKKPITPGEIAINIHHKRLQKTIPAAGLKYADLVQAIREAYAIGRDKAREFVTYFGQDQDWIYKDGAVYKYRKPHNAKDFKAEYPDEINDDAPF